MPVRKPLIDLERECSRAREKDLLDEFLFCPTSSQPYMLLRFHSTTHDAILSKILAYVKRNYDVDNIELNIEDKTLYIVYDFWKRFPSDY